MIEVDLVGVLAFMFFGWVLFNSAFMAVKVWWSGRENRRIGQHVARRQAYLADLPRQEWRPSGNKHIAAMHNVCGTRHLSWEACPEALPRWAGRIDGDGG